MLYRDSNIFKYKYKYINNNTTIASNIDKEKYMYRNN